MLETLVKGCSRQGLAGEANFVSFLINKYRKQYLCTVIVVQDYNTGQELGMIGRTIFVSLTKILLLVPSSDASIVVTIGILKANREAFVQRKVDSTSALIQIRLKPIGCIRQVKGLFVFLVLA